MHLFGSIDKATTSLSKIGEVADITWNNLSSYFNIEMDEYIIMPNHLHGIIWINSSSKDENDKVITHSSLISIVKTYKSLSSRRIHSLGYPFQIWQRSFYDTIIKDEAHLEATREYIRNNPTNWKLDADFS
jgi:putative transposase